MARPRIAIIGIASQREPLMRRAEEMGFEPHAFSWRSSDSDELGPYHFHAIGMQESQKILDVCCELQVEAVVPVGSDMAAKSAAYVSEKMGLPGNSRESVTFCLNKVLTRGLFARAGLPQPDYVEVASEIPEAVSHLGFPLVVKPSDRSGCRGVRKVCSREELYRAIDAARDVSYENVALAESYVDGTLYSCECLSMPPSSPDKKGAHEVVAITRRFVREVDGAFCETGYLQPSGLSAKQSEAVSELACDALDVLGVVSGASSVEIWVTKEGKILLNEVTPTMYGDYVGCKLTQMSTGIDYPELVILLALGRYGGPLAARAGNRSEVRFVYVQDDLDGLAGASPSDALMRDVPRASSLPEKSSSQRGGCYILRAESKAFGGMPALRLGRGTGLPLHLRDFENGGLLRFNSEIAAFRYALSRASVARAWIPWYSAPAWEKAAMACGVPVERYFLSDDLTPKDVGALENEAILVPNCLGQADLGKVVERMRASCPSAILIIDNSQAFYEVPDIGRGIYNIYSPRKFFAVPDGGYLVGEGFDGAEELLERDVSYKRARTLLMSLELGEEAPYKERMSNEQELLASPKGMSMLTQKMISSIDHVSELKAREMNYNVLKDRLGGIQELDSRFLRNAVPQFYPLLVTGDIRAKLVARKVFVPLMWRHLLEGCFKGTIEQRLASGLLALPIDQRYSPEDMEYIANIVLSLL